MTHRQVLLRLLHALALTLLMVACGSGGDPEPERVAITAEPADQGVLDEVNRVRPAGYRLDSLKSLPMPVDDDTGSGALRASR